MNKRQRKKRSKKNRDALLKGFLDFAESFYNPHESRMRWHLLPHKRRHWLSRQEFQQKKRAYLADLAKEKAEAIARYNH